MYGMWDDFWTRNDTSAKERQKRLECEFNGHYLLTGGKVELELAVSRIRIYKLLKAHAESFVFQFAIQKFKDQDI